jgi:hypothetical protein
VIDECYVVLNQRYTIRKQMQQLGKLVAAETQTVMLKATWNSIGKYRGDREMDGAVRGVWNWQLRSLYGITHIEEMDVIPKPCTFRDAKMYQPQYL